MAIRRMCIPSAAPVAQEITASNAIVRSLAPPQPASGGSRLSGSMQGLQEAAGLLARRAGRPLHPVEFRPIAVASPPPRCLAADGSSAVLVDNGAAWVVAVRAVAVAWPGPAQAEP